MEKEENLINKEVKAELPYYSLKNVYQILESEFGLEKSYWENFSIEAGIMDEHGFLQKEAAQYFLRKHGNELSELNGAWFRDQYTLTVFDLYLTPTNAYRVCCKIMAVLVTDEDLHQKYKEFKTDHAKQ